MIYDQNLSSHNKKRTRIEIFDKNENQTTEEEHKSFTKKKVKGNANPFTGREYSEKYYKILEQRKKLPAWDARE